MLPALVKPSLLVKWLESGFSDLLSSKCKLLALWYIFFQAVVEGIQVGVHQFQMEFLLLDSRLLRDNKCAPISDA